MQKFVNWSEELSIGVKEIDQQHKNLVAMLNELSQAIDGGWGRRTRDQIIDKLLEHTQVHFATEENLMSVFAYPDSDKHKKQHEALVIQVHEYLDHFNSDPHASSYDLLFFLRKWLTEHILKEDKAMGEFMVARGVGKTAPKKSWLGRLFGSR